MRYCSEGYQKAHRPKHKELSERGARKGKGLGDTQDNNVYVSHITPKQQDRTAKLVGRKCSVQCCLDDKPLEVLWDTGAQVSILFKGVLKSQLSSVQIQDVE